MIKNLKRIRRWFYNGTLICLILNVVLYCIVRFLIGEYWPAYEILAIILFVYLVAMAVIKIIMKKEKKRIIDNLSDFEYTTVRLDTSNALFEELLKDTRVEATRYGNGKITIKFTFSNCNQEVIKWISLDEEKAQKHLLEVKNN